MAASWSSIRRWRRTRSRGFRTGAPRDEDAVRAALADLRAAAQEGRNVMPASIAAAKAGATTGEWAGEMRAVHGEYRGPTGVSKAVSNKTEGSTISAPRWMPCRTASGGG
jgi:hypothetical protein